MRVAFLLPTTLGNSGGVKIVCEYANRMREMGIECDLIYPTIPSNYNRYKFKNAYKTIKFFGTIVLNFLHYNEKKFKEKYKFISIKKVKSLKQIKKIYMNYDLIYATAWDTYYYINELPIKRGYLVQSFEIWDGPDELVLNTYKDDSIKYCVITKYLQQKIQKGMDTTVVYNPIEELADNQIKNKEIKIIFGVIYRKGKNKNFNSIIEFLKSNEEYQKKFVCLARSLPQKYKKYFLKVYDGNKEVKKFYEEISCFIMPSLHEGFGLPILEALNYENLLISNLTGILSDFENEIEFINLSREKMLLDAVKEVEGFDGMKRKKIIEENRIFINKYRKKYSWEKNIEQLMGESKCENSIQ